MQIDKNKLNIAGLILVLCLVLYYLHTYHTKKLIKDEMRKFLKYTKKNSVQNNIQYERIPEPQYEHVFPQMQQLSQQDMDSYIEPDEKNIDMNDDLHDDYNYNNFEVQEKKQHKLTSNNVLLRDMTDGSCK